MTLELSNQFIFIGALLTLLCIVSSVVSRKLGAPILLVFLVLGMLAGEDGPGGIIFNDYGLAFLLGNLALAIIILDGGLGTRREAFRVSLNPALSLATLGVVITAGITGLAAHLILALPILDSLLIGAIVGSTDAAAVFGLLRSAGLQLKERTGATLEIESGTNDPMAIFLTVTLVQVLAHNQAPGATGIVWVLLQQMGLGLLLGFIGGRGFCLFLERIDLPASLYPLCVLAGGLGIFGLTSLLNGSGFLAIYVLGVIVGNTALPFSKDIHRFHDGIAWLSQIGMFLMLGLLITPSHLPPIIIPALGIALVLIFIARPIAVALSLLPFHFPTREQVFISWCGLRGAVPIILALYPSLSGLHSTELVFELVFFVVLVSLVVQGWSIAPVARWLGVNLPVQVTDPKHFQVALPTELDKVLHVYEVIGGCRANNTLLAELPLTEGAQAAGVIRDGVLKKHSKILRLEEGDHVMILASEDTASMGTLFSPKEDIEVTRQAVTSFYGEFVISPDTTLGELRMFYGLDTRNLSPSDSVGQFLFRRFHGRPVVGDTVALGHLQLVIRRIEGNRIAAVGLKLPHSPPG